MIGFYIIFGLLCILLGFAIVSWFIISKEIRNRINDCSDYNEFIEFDDYFIININKIQRITKTKLYINIYFDEDNSISKRFNSEEECNKRYLDILDCITYHPKSY